MYVPERESEISDEVLDKESLKKICAEKSSEIFRLRGEKLGLQKEIEELEEKMLAQHNAAQAHNLELVNRIDRLRNALDSILGVTMCDCGDDPDPDEADYCPYCIAEKALREKSDE